MLSTGRVKLEEKQKSFEKRKKNENFVKMDSEDFRKRGKEMVDYIADYLDSIHQRRVFPEVEPGYLEELIPNEAPEKPEDWDEIIKVLNSTLFM